MNPVPVRIDGRLEAVLGEDRLDLRRASRLGSSNRISQRVPPV